MKFPFSNEQFWNIIENYSAILFPVQILLFLFGCFIPFVIYTKNNNLDKFIGYLIGCIWLWTGIVYHILFFTEITKAAYIFGAMFIIQGIIFIFYAYRGKLLFVFTNTMAQRISCFFCYIWFIDLSFNHLGYNSPPLGAVKSGVEKV